MKTAAHVILSPYVLRLYLFVLERVWVWVHILGDPQRSVTTTAVAVCFIGLNVDFTGVVSTVGDGGVLREEKKREKRKKKKNKY